MIERGEAMNSVRKARALIGERMAGNPGYGVYVHASEQLERMLKDLGSPYLPPAAKREWVDIGLMAAKELEAVDPDLANALMDADYDFKHAN
ncbi:immunity protein Tsi6 family protein [Rhodanobacter ginsengisoli]|uniref:Immunity protein Tsi6 family protein n=1 Tax=Rhodanobacter ginsengisoli TaxID=418646 RepID=A0ABW0QUH3_9GAMM